MSRRAARPPAPDAAQPTLAELVVAPLANPLAVFMPTGRRRPRGKKAEPEVQLVLFDELPAIAKKSKAAKLTIERLRATASMLDHYARTDLPIEKVARHCQLTLERTTIELAKRGRHV